MRAPTQAVLAGFFKKNDTRLRVARNRMYSREKWMMSSAAAVNRPG